MADNSSELATLQIHRDRHLARRVVAGDECALREFIDNYFPRLYRYARHRLADDNEVDDVVQATLSQAARRLATYRGEATLLTWLVQICRHEIGRSLARSCKRADLMTPYLHDDLLRAVVESLEAEPSCEPEHQQHRHELVTLIQGALDQLSEVHARALELKYIDGLSSREIAAALTISDAATQSLLARARQAFREVCGETLRAWNDNPGDTGR